LQNATGIQVANIWCFFNQFAYQIIKKGIQCGTSINKQSCKKEYTEGMFAMELMKWFQQDLVCSGERREVCEQVDLILPKK